MQHCIMCEKLFEDQEQEFSEIGKQVDFFENDVLFPSGRVIFGKGSFDTDIYIYKDFNPDIGNEGDLLCEACMNKLTNDGHQDTQFTTLVHTDNWDWDNKATLLFTLFSKTAIPYFIPDRINLEICQLMALGQDLVILRKFYYSPGMDYPAEFFYVYPRGYVLEGEKDGLMIDSQDLIIVKDIKDLYSMLKNDVIPYDYSA